MLNAKWGVLGLVCAACCLGGGSLAWADGGNGAEIAVMHEVARYPGGEPQPGDAQVFLTKDEVEKVRAFFAAHLHKGDLLQPFAEENAKGYRLVNPQHYAGRDHEVVHLTLAARIPNETLPVFGQLQALVRMNKHTDAEFQAVEKKYDRLTRAYFKSAFDEAKDRYQDEGTRIYEKYFRLAYPENAALEGRKRPKPSAADKAEAADIKARLKAMKAKGDMAGMMALAQQASSRALQASGVEKATDEMMNKDTWDTWIACLKEMDAAAYWTELHYTSGTLKGAE